MAVTLNKNLLEEIINEPIKSFTSGEGSKEGDNLVGNIQTIFVQTLSGNELNLVYKSLPVESSFREYAVREGIFRTENTFYSFFAPALQKWAKSKNPKFDYSCLSLPIFYKGVNDDLNDYLCMEDLRTKGYGMADKFIGLNFEETALALKKLATFHALTFGFIREEEYLRNEQFAIFDVNVASKNKNWRDILTKVLVDSYAMIVDFLKKDDPSLAERMEKKAPKTSEDCLVTFLETGKKYFPVIAHGDFWMNNILFKYGEFDVPEEVKFIDFQLTRHGNIFEDLQYFIFTSTTPEFRKDHLIPSLNTYYTSFMSTLEDLNCEKPTNFTRDWFVNSFKGCYFQAFIYMCLAVPFQLVGGEKPAQEVKTEKVSETKSNEPTEQPSAQEVLLIGLRMAFESSPRAQNRIKDIANELIEMQLL